MGAPASSVPVLAVRGLSVAVRRGAQWLPAVDSVAFEVGPGEALALVGESGCGKSLTAASLLRLLPPERARVGAEELKLLGEEIGAAGEGRLRQLRGAKVGMVFQDQATFLNPVLEVGAQVAEPLRAHLGLDGRQARQRVVELFGAVGIPEPERRLSAYPHELSGGQRQRVLIAAALACDPALLIADEPTTALDVTLQAQILRLLDAERSRRGMGLLFITHDLGVVARLCERIAVMYAGRIVETGRTADVFRRPAHPYTAALLAAARALDAGRDKGAGLPARLPMLAGTVPPLEAFAPCGCRFRDRCPRADARCAAETPVLTSSPAGPRAAACHHPLT